MKIGNTFWTHIKTSGLSLENQETAPQSYKLANVDVCVGVHSAAADVASELPNFSYFQFYNYWFFI